MSADVDQLVHEYTNLAHAAVADALRWIPPYIETDDLYSAALLALVRCARRYDPDQGVPFGSYARTRVRGAVLDELRRIDWRSRGDRRRIREGAAPVGLSPDRPLSLDHLVDNDDESIAMRIEDARPDPETELLRRELVEYVADAVVELPTRLQAVVRNYLREEPLGALADHLGVSPCRVSQMRSEAFTLLRNAVHAAYEPTHLPENDNPTGCFTRRRDAYYRAVQLRNRRRRDVTAVPA